MFLPNIHAIYILVNIFLSLSLSFVGVKPEEALRQFKERIEFYEKAYEPIAPDEGLSHIKMYDVGKKIVVEHLPRSYLPGRVVFFLMNLHIMPRSIFLVGGRHAIIAVQSDSIYIE